jgi:hypothetical protein
MNRKDYPLFSGVLRYFPDALLEVAHCSKVGNDQHNPGEPLHWAREKSTDDADALVRHLLDAGKVDDDGVRHSAKAAWRALAVLQKEIEAEHAAIKTVTTSINVTDTADATLDDLADTAALERLRQPFQAGKRPSGSFEPVNVYRSTWARECDEYTHWFPQDKTRCFCGFVTRPSPAQIGIDAMSPSWERIPVPPPAAQDAYIDEEGDVTR